MQNLQTLIDLLTKGRRIHISILDVSGALTSDATRICFNNTIHSTEFCRLAKSTDRGLKLCLYCKGLANGRAIEERVSFCGECMYGLCEAAVPVISGGSVLAVVYVGNSVIDRKKTEERIKHVCRRSGADERELIRELERCEPVSSFGELLGIGEIVSDYIKLLVKSMPESPKRHSWLVDAIRRHADETYAESPTLGELSIIYHKNKKYLGRLFKNEMGVDFSEYCLGLRLASAERALRETDEKIIDIALSSGFNNISYFNRVFKERYGMPPREWRIAVRSGAVPS